MNDFTICDQKHVLSPLQDTMVYVNCIAEYLHTAIHDNLGFPNKNIGDAWLMTWPLNDGAWTSTGPGVRSIQIRCFHLFHGACTSTVPGVFFSKVFISIRKFHK